MLGKICKKHENETQFLLRCEKCLDEFKKSEYERGKLDGLELAAKMIKSGPTYVELMDELIEGEYHRFDFKEYKNRLSEFVLKELEKLKEAK